ncbi:membrane protein insertase YidC [Candidatus Gracilibacteria bacterium]|nr:membrane protein insertase YidC [Candidatus Gracilibacteria bacterium]
MNKFKDFIKSFLIWFAIFYLVILGIEKFFGKKDQSHLPSESQVIITPIKKSMVIGNLIAFKVENKLDEKITFPSPCENPGSLKVLRLANDNQFNISENAFENCNGKSVSSFELEPGSKITFGMKDFNLDLFSEPGKYQLEMNFEQEENIETVLSLPIEIKSPGVFRQLFRAIISKPLFNILVFLTNKLPGHPFGWAIIILTILVRIALFVPNQKSMRSQREMQKLQPKLEELKQQYGKNQQMMAMKTMELYKTHKINPMGSCLPIMFQMPFLLGIYYIVRDGLSPHLNYLLYSFQQGVDLSVVNSAFFGLNLDYNGPIVLAVLVGLMQWIAIKLSFISAKKRANKNSDKPVVKKDGPAGQMQQMNKVMLWMMPIMIAMFVTSFPAGVGIYWLTSTIFGIFQQRLVNWQLDQPQVVRKES